MDLDKVEEFYNIRFFTTEDIDEVGEFEADITCNCFLEDIDDSNQSRSDERSPNPPFNNPPNMPPFNNPPNNPANMPPFNSPSGPKIGAPPTFTPNKNESKSKQLSGPSLKAIDSGAIRPCLRQFVYIWQTNGYSYWAYLTYVGPKSIAGFRWIGFRWVYFGLDLRRIDSFYCY